MYARFFLSPSEGNGDRKLEVLLGIAVCSVEHKNDIRDITTRRVNVVPTYQ